MNDYSHIKFHKKWFDSDMFKDEVYSDFQAFVWLNCKAYTKNSIKSIGNKKVKINKGELYVGRRELKNIWRWGGIRIQEFLHELRRCNLVNLEERYGFTIIKMVNYNKEQGVEKVSDKDIPQFNEFWETYIPIHTSKGSKKVTKAAYLKALKITNSTDIMEGLQIYLKECKANNTYTKAPTTWLNQEMWEIESTEESEKSSYINKEYKEMMFYKNKEKKNDTNR